MRVLLNSVRPLLGRKIPAFIPALLFSGLLILISGCSESVGQSAEAPPRRADRANSSDDKPQSPRLPRANQDDLSSSTDESSEGESASQTGLIGSLRNMIQSTSLFQESDVEEGLLQQLDDASTQLADIRKQNREAIQAANRQVRLGVGVNTPNMILIQLDPVSAVELWASEADAPHFSKLLSSGLDFTNHYSASADLKLARWSLMTGQNPAVRTTVAKDSALPSRQILPLLLWNGGYRTAFVGQWDDPALPLQRGFDEWVGFRNRNEATPFPEKVATDKTEMRLIGISGESETEKVHFIDLMGAEISHFLKRNNQSRTPFFLFVSLPEFPEAKEARLARIDQLLGKVTETLTESRLDRSTCLILTAESGPVSEDSTTPRSNGIRNAPHRLGEGDLRIPLLISWQGQITPGKSDRICASWDLLPTILEVTNSRGRPKEIDGLSFAPTLRSRSQKEHPLLYWATPDKSAQAVRRENWKGVFIRGEGGVRLYDLKNDPGETLDVAKEHPEIVKQLIVN